MFVREKIVISGDLSEIICKYISCYIYIITLIRYFNYMMPSITQKTVIHNRFDIVDLLLRPGRYVTAPL